MSKRNATPCPACPVVVRMVDTLRRAEAAAGAGDHDREADHRASANALREELSRVRATSLAGRAAQAITAEQIAAEFILGMPDAIVRSGYGWHARTLAKLLAHAAADEFGDDTELEALRGLLGRQNAGRTQAEYGRSALPA